MDKKENIILKALEGAIGSWRESVPDLFFRTFAGQPFEKCDYCRASLIDPVRRYMNNKYYSDGNLQQETVQCYECRQDVKGIDSKESTSKIRNLFSDVDRMKRLEIASNSSINRAEVLTGSCIICGRSKQETSIYFEYAYCEGHEIVYFIHPFMICGKCTVSLYDSLSEETKRNRQRFYKKHYGTPPGINSPKIYEYLFKTMEIVK